MKTLRVAYARINQETNALTTVLTKIEDFERVHYLQGSVLHAAVQRAGVEAEGFLRRAELHGFADEAVKVARKRGLDLTLHPLLSAWCVPAGPLSTACFEELIARLLAGLERVGEVDAIYLCLHGAMGVHELDIPVTSSPEGEIVRRVRERVGRDIPIGVSLDLHANVTPVLVDESDFIVAYRTNPHRDHVSIGRSCADLLIRTAVGEIRPRMSWRSLPMILGGGAAVDFLPPMRGIFQRARAMEKEGSVLSASLCMCHPWNSHPELGWSTLVVYDEKRGPAAAKLADDRVEELAERCWAARHKMPPDFLTPEQAIDKVRRARLLRKIGTCVFSDASDVVSAGATGESTTLLQALIDKAQGLVTWAPIRDAVAVDTLWDRPIGTTVRTQLGGRTDTEGCHPIEVEAELVGRYTNHGTGRTLVLRIGTVHIVVVEGPALAVQPRFYTSVGANLWKADLVIVKNFFPFLVYFLPYARMYGFIRTRGVTDFDAAFSIGFAGAIHPRDAIDSWRETDRRRRNPDAHA